MRYRELFEDEILDEMPMPVDWDKSVYTPQTSYAKRIKYAVERALKIGKGSSRTAFVISIDGKDSVLKVAHNKKGLAQNDVEAEILSDSYAQQLGIVIPLIDYDEEHDEPLWINTERAAKATESVLCKLMKCERLTQLIGAAMFLCAQAGSWDYKRGITEEQIKLKFGEEGLETFNEYATKLAELAQFDVQLRDFDRAANWGLYNGHPVVLDLGFTSYVKSSHYS